MPPERQPRLECTPRPSARAELQAICISGVRASVRHAVEEIRSLNAAQPAKADKLRREVAEVEQERDNLVAAIAAGQSKPEAVLAAIAEREQHIEVLRRELAQLDSPAILDQLADKRAERDLIERTAHWREVLAGDPVLSRQALRKLLASPIRLIPQADGYELRGSTRLGALFDSTSAKMASPRGREAIPIVNSTTTKLK